MRSMQDAFVQLAATAVLLNVLAGVASSQEIRWLNGNEVDRALKSSVTITWQQMPLREGLRRLSAKTGLGLFLDRRLDPDQTVEVRQMDVPLGTVLQELAHSHQAVITRIGSVLYFGPREDAGDLAKLSAQRRQEMGKLPAPERSRLTAVHSWNWEELTQPRQLVEQLAQEAGLKIANLGSVPHDLWPAVSLPPLSWSDRMTVVLAGFRLTFEIDGTTGTLLLKPM